MPEILHTINEILENGECPICGFPASCQMSFNNPENEQLGIFCPGCGTDFIDVESSREEYEGW